MGHFIRWLGATPVSLFFQTQSWIVPSVQMVHILALAAVFSSMMMFDVRLLGWAGRSRSIPAQASRFLPVMWVCIPILLATGLVLITAEPKRSLQNVAFFSKMAMLAVVLVITWMLQLDLKRRPAFWSDPAARPRIASLVGAASLMLWVGIVMAGRFIAYV